MGKSTISMAIFNSYVSLPEGIHGHFPCFLPLPFPRFDGGPKGGDSAHVAHGESRDA